MNAERLFAIRIRTNSEPVRLRRSQRLRLIGSPAHVCTEALNSPGTRQVSHDISESEHYTRQLSFAHRRFQRILRVESRLQGSIIQPTRDIQSFLPPCELREATSILHVSQCAITPVSSLPNTFTPQPVLRSGRLLTQEERATMRGRLPRYIHN